MEITVKDIINLSDKTVTALDEVMTRLSALSQVYQNTDDIHALENLKKEFNANLQYMAKEFSKVKRYKGPNHVYLETAIKRIKSETIDQLLLKGGSVTAAERLVYSHPYYVERMKVADQLIQFCLKVEMMYDQYNSTLSCIVQSISVASKEFNHSKSVG